MVCPQNVRYNSPNRMYISQKISGVIPPDTLAVIKCYARQKYALFNNLCIRLTEIKLLKIYYSSYRINVFLL